MCITFTRQLNSTVNATPLHTLHAYHTQHATPKPPSWSHIILSHHVQHALTTSYTWNMCHADVVYQHVLLYWCVHTWQQHHTTLYNCVDMPWSYTNILAHIMHTNCNTTSCNTAHTPYHHTTTTTSHHTMPHCIYPNTTQFIHAYTPQLFTHTTHMFIHMCTLSDITNYPKLYTCFIYYHNTHNWQHTTPTMNHTTTTPHTQCDV